MRVVSVVSTKGGVGKTTVAANLGGLLADVGLRVLLLDLDTVSRFSVQIGFRIFSTCSIPISCEGRSPMTLNA